MKRLNLFLFFFFSISLIVNSYAQENRLTVSGLIGSNYGIIKSEFLSDIDKSWHPGIVIGTNVSYRFTQTLSVESGLNYELIRLGRYYYENTIPGNGSEGPTYEGRYTIVNKFNYLSVPLNLSYRFWGNLSAFAGAGYRFELGNPPTQFGKMYSTEPFGNIGISYKIDDFRVALGYSVGLRDGILSKPDGERNRTVSFTLSYPLYYK